MEQRSVWTSGNKTETTYGPAHIDHFQDSTNIWVEKADHISYVVTSYFNELFTSSNPSIQDDISELVIPKITAATFKWLSAPYMEEELYHALTKMGPHKASGPDGLTAHFYQKFWNEVKQDIVLYSMNILNCHGSVQEINRTFISLIPKVTKAENMQKFRPINLCNGLYKMVAKIVANHLKVALPTIISPEQSAFVKGRLITDNALIAYELLHFIKNRFHGRVGQCAIKLDMSKAYDWTEWCFVAKMMKRLGFPDGLIELVSGFISTVTYQPSINGEPTSVVVSHPGLRQGELLSPYLFIICAEGLSTCLRKAVQEGHISGGGEGLRVMVVRVYLTSYLQTILSYFVLQIK